MERKRAAILMADIAGYTRLMEAFEQDTHKRLMSLRDAVVNVSLAAYEGHVVKRTGDGFLALFSQARQALDCAMAIERGTRQGEVDQPPDRRISFRIGVNIGDVMVETEDVYGNDVNIAARLQDLAEPGEILISASIRENLGADSELSTIDLGLLSLKNISRSVHAFRVELGGAPIRPRIRSNPFGRSAIDRCASVSHARL